MIAVDPTEDRYLNFLFFLVGFLTCLVLLIATSPCR